LIRVEYRATKAGRWRPLSESATRGHARWQAFGWMLVFENCSWGTSEGDMGRADELIEVLRGRQAKLDAPSVLDRCEEAGVVVIAEGESLRARGPLTDELREDLRRCKPELLKLLADVPAWDDAEAAELQARLKLAHAACRRHLHPAVDDPFSVAGRNVLADMLATVARAIAVRRLDLLRRRVDWILGWFGTLEKRLLELRTRPATQRP
jgi:hypothetical protein